jgi:hypothetical protein
MNRGEFVQSLSGGIARDSVRKMNPALCRERSKQNETEKPIMAVTL